MGYIMSRICGENMVYTPDKLSFVLNDVERMRADEWINEHRKVCRLTSPEEQKMQQRLFVQGGFISYIFSPNAAFVAVSIKCTCTEEDIDITDYNSV